MIRSMETQIIEVRTGGRETIRDITGECAEFAGAASGGGDGLLHVFVPHATAGIALIELGARSDHDLLATLAGLLPADERWQHAHGSRGHGLPGDAGHAGELLLGQAASLPGQPQPGPVRLGNLRHAPPPLVGYLIITLRPSGPEPGRSPADC